MGKLIVIEGLDGAGKSTQLAMTAERCSEMYPSVRKLKFPKYESEGCALVRGYLNGLFGKSPDDVNCYAAASFYAADRYISFIDDWRIDYERGTLFLLDRYTTSNMIYQTAKLPREQWDEFLDWLGDYEYARLTLPRPDAVIFLSVSDDVTEKMLEKRYGGDENLRDIHEKDREYLARCRSAAEYCADKYGWTIIDCCEDGAMLSVEQINDKIIAAVRNTLDA